MTYKEHFEKFLAEKNREKAFGDFENEYDVYDIYDICKDCDYFDECENNLLCFIKWDTQYEPKKLCSWVEESVNNLVEDEMNITDIHTANILPLINFESKDERLLINNPSPVSHPLHYNAHNIEVIDFIQDWELNFALGNAIKYICRAPYKGKQIEDIEKAIQYLEFELLDLLQKKNKNK